MAARSSGSVISGKSIKLSIGRPLRVCRRVSRSNWTCSSVGCAGMSMPNSRKQVRALSTACWYSALMTCSWTCRLQTPASSTLVAARGNSSAISCPVFSELPHASSHSAHSNSRLNCNSYSLLQSCSSNCAMPAAKCACADVYAAEALALRPARRSIAATRTFSL